MKATIVNVSFSESGCIVTYSSGTERPYKADSLPKTVQAWLEAHTIEDTPEEVEPIAEPVPEEVTENPSIIALPMVVKESSQERAQKATGAAWTAPKTMDGGFVDGFWNMADMALDFAYSVLMAWDVFTIKAPGRIEKACEMLTRLVGVIMSVLMALGKGLEVIKKAVKAVSPLALAAVQEAARVAAVAILVSVGALLRAGKALVRIWKAGWAMRAAIIAEQRA